MTADITLGMMLGKYTWKVYDQSRRWPGDQPFRAGFMAERMRGTTVQRLEATEKSGEFGSEKADKGVTHRRSGVGGMAMPESPLILRTKSSL